jgi:DNA-binding response OmpR family regulator
MSHALIIEDELFLAMEMEEVLEDLGYPSCDVVSSMQQAIREAGRRCPDLIIADQTIVGGSGTQAIAEICAEVPIPVVFVTASGDEVLERLPEALVVDKPFDMARLKAAIDLAIERPFSAA